MIIGNWFQQFLQGFQVDIIQDNGNPVTADIQFGYGDQDELLKWIEFKDKGIKYPLIWYPLAEVKERQNWAITDNELIILTDSNIKLLNDERFTETYTGIIQPIWDALYKKLLKSSSFNFLGGKTQEERYQIYDKPNFGVSDNDNIRTSQNSFVSKKSESVVTDIVDARIIAMKFEVNVKCIN